MHLNSRIKNQIDFNKRKFQDKPKYEEAERKSYRNIKK